MTRSEMLEAAIGILSGLCSDIVLSKDETEVAQRALRSVRRIAGTPSSSGRIAKIRTIQTSRENCNRATAEVFRLLVLCAGGESLRAVRFQTVRAARLTLFLGERLYPFLPEVRKVILEKLKKIQSFETNCMESVTNATGATN